MDVMNDEQADGRERSLNRELSEFEIRLADGGDLPAIFAINRDSERPSASLEAMAESLVNPQRHWVVAVAEGEIVGWAKTHYWDCVDDPAPAGHYLGGITVHPQWRRRGVGTALTSVRLDWIWARAIDAWYVVNERNHASIELHRGWGFEEVARASAFHATTFTGGVGLLMHARRHPPTHTHRASSSS